MLKNANVALNLRIYSIDFWQRNNHNSFNIFQDFFINNIFSNYIMHFWQKFYTANFCSYKDFSLYCENNSFLTILYLAYLMKRCKIEIKFFLSIKGNKGIIDYFYNFLFFVFIILFVIMHIVDSLMLSIRGYTDGFGFPIISWNSNGTLHKD